MGGANQKIVIQNPANGGVYNGDTKSSSKGEYGRTTKIEDDKN